MASRVLETGQSASASIADPSVSGSSDADVLYKGDLVGLRGLQMRPQLNGEEAVVTGYFPDKQRWSVETLASGEKILLRRANMVVLERWSVWEEVAAAETFGGVHINGG